MLVAAVGSAREGGSKAGDGGNGIICRTNIGDSAELYDLYEARRFGGLPYSMEVGEPSLEDELTFARSNWTLLFGETKLVRVVFDEIMMKRQTLSWSPTDLPPSFDVDPFSAMLPPNCHLVQAALFVYLGPGIGSIQIDQAFWRMTDNRTRAALLVHESLRRWLNSSDSRNIYPDTLRRIVGLSFVDSYYLEQHEDEVKKFISDTMIEPSLK